MTNSSFAFWNLMQFFFLNIFYSWLVELRGYRELTVYNFLV